MDPGQDTNEDLHGTDNDFLAVGPALRILQLNVEGLSAAKRSVISSIADKEKIDIICLEETHVDGDIASRFSISGFDLVSYALHPKHGRATYVRGNITEAAHVLSTPHCDVIRVGGYHIANVYKPPVSTGTVLMFSRHCPILPCSLEISIAITPTGVTKKQTRTETSCKTGLRLVILISPTTPSSEAHSIPPDGSETTRLTSAGHQ
jgi:hypothetical protein